MGFGVSLILIAVGLILALAVNTSSSAVDIHTVGWIVAIIGFVGLLMSMIFWNTWAGPGYWSRRRTTYVDEGPPPA
jgi:Na+/proline symporter